MSSIFYTCVARQDVVLAHAGKDERNKKQFYASIRDVLASFGAQDNLRASKQQNNMLFYVFIQSGLTYLCFTDTTVQKSSAYSFLQEVANQFTSKYQPSSYKFAQELSMDAEFSAVLLGQMSSIKKMSKTADLQQNLDEVKGLVMDNISKVMDRAQDLDKIADSALQLRDNADDFVISTKAVKNQMLKKKIMIICGIAVAVVVVILIIVLPIVL